jgi:pilus assembly protein Flp/PilA
MKSQFIQFLKDEEGATAIEYGLIAGLIAVAIIASLSSVRTQLVAVFNAIADALTAAITPTPPAT